ncbi:MAG TPA: hypothetical protein VG273_04385 [Bryobacteraceae bacterium]|jgi:hypothetical protein|nr:hypothetical protein [Bryobacteraceae bacterium]
MTAKRRRFTLSLVLIALICAIPRLLLGASQFIEYDGYWHVFIAQQDNWQNFWEDIRVNAHPPLFFLLLKVLVHYGRSLLVYRAISLVTGTASVFCVGWIARKVVKSDGWAYASALAYGLALPAIIMSCEVRSYMLSAFFILLSFACLLEIGGSSDSELPDSRVDLKHDLKARAGFAVAAILACLSHYYAFYYSGAAAALLIGWCALRKYRGERASWSSEAATIAPVLGLIGYLYWAHASLKADIQSHLLPFYYDPKGVESIPAFLIRNWTNLLNLFLPYDVYNYAVAGAILAGAVISAVVLLRIFLRARDAVANRAASTIVITSVMLAGIALTAVVGKYPFGGDLRQQFLFLPFFVLCAAILADSLTARLPENGRMAAAALLALIVCALSIQQYERYPKTSQDVLSDRIDEFNRLEPRPVAVYVDQFNLIAFFTAHHNWHWTSLPQQPIPGIDIYRISRGQQQMLVFRDLTEWNVKPEDAGIYKKIDECLRDGKTPEVSVFSGLQTPPSAPFSDLRKIKHDVVSQSAGSSVCVQRLTVNAAGWYGTFRQSGCTADDMKPPQLSGVFDGVRDEIQYSGAWTRGSYPEAVGGTENYTNAPSASAQLTFEGTEITWVYARAWNRGIGSVKIDGVPRGEVDLYSPKIIWQAKTVFGDLPRGRHTFEVTVTGKKTPASSDHVIDVDALIVR